MPILHRLSCFRDDLVFLIYLYQRWVYRVDPDRPNEYGRSAKDYDEQQQALARGAAAGGDADVDAAAGVGGEHSHAD